MLLEEKQLGKRNSSQQYKYLNRGKIYHWVTVTPKMTAEFLHQQTSNPSAGHLQLVQNLFMSHYPLDFPLLCLHHTLHQQGNELVVIVNVFPLPCRSLSEIPHSHQPQVPAPPEKRFTQGKSFIWPLFKFSDFLLTFILHSSRRSLSPIAIRPSPLGPVKRKCDLEDRNDSSWVPNKKYQTYFTSGSSTSAAGNPLGASGSLLGLTHPLSHSNSAE